MKKTNKLIIGIVSLVLVVGTVFAISSTQSKKSNIDSASTDKTQGKTAISAYVDDKSQESVVESTFLLENRDPVIKKLVSDYYEVILNADKDAYDAITVDDDSMDVDVMLRKMEYIEGYDNQKIYVAQGSDHVSMVIYVVYDLKIHSIDTPAPSIDQLLIHNVNGEPKLYFNELTAKETKQLELIRSHEEVVDLIQEVNQSFTQAIKSDTNLNDFYQAISAK